MPRYALASSEEPSDTDDVLFKLDQHLGNGSFGSAYKASQLKHGTPMDVLDWDSRSGWFSQKKSFTLKFIPGGSLSEPHSYSHLYHPSIVHCYHIWSEEDEDGFIAGLEGMKGSLLWGRSAVIPSDESMGSLWKEEFEASQSVNIARMPPFLVIQMEYCDQGRIDNWITRRPDSSWIGVVHPESCQIFSRLVDALAYLHLKGIVHCDITPGNVLLSSLPDGTLVPKLCDFGLSHLEKEACVRWNDLIQPTQSQIDAMIEGRRRFVSPEQIVVRSFNCLGFPEYQSTHKSDIYALGLIWLGLLFPFGTVEDYNRAVCEAMKDEDFRSLPEFEVELEGEVEMLHLMLSWSSNLRPNAAELETFLKDSSCGRGFLVANSTNAEVAFANKNPGENQRVEKRLDFQDALALVPAQEVDLSIPEEDGSEKEFTLSLRNRYHLLMETLHMVASNGDEVLLKRALPHLEPGALNLFGGRSPSWSTDGRFMTQRFLESMRRGDPFPDPETENRLKYFLAYYLSHSKKEQKPKALTLLKEVLTSVWYNDLDLLHNHRLDVQIAEWEIKTGSRIGLPFGHPDLGEECFFESLDVIRKSLSKARAMSAALANILRWDCLTVSTAYKLFKTIVGMTSLLGDMKEAEKMILEVLVPHGLTIHQILKRDDVDPNRWPPSWHNLLLKYVEFLMRITRFDEAIGIMEKLRAVYKKHGMGEDEVNAVMTLAILHAGKVEPGNKELVLGLISEGFVKQDLQKCERTGLLINASALDRKVEVAFLSDINK